LGFETFAGCGEEQLHGIRGPVCILQIKEKAPIQKGKKGRNPKRGPNTNPEGKEREEPKERTKSTNPEGKEREDHKERR
jgi:hypothetical protein